MYRKLALVTFIASICIPAAFHNKTTSAGNKKLTSRVASWPQLQSAFPRNFIWGAATSAFQVEGTQTANEGHAQNSWTRHKKILPQPGIACGFWNRNKEVVRLIKQAGLSMYRFSIAWEKIEPQHGVYDQAALDHYIEFIDELLAHGIEPMVCLFHHTWPTWFDDTGAFERPHNIKYFVRFANYVFKNLKDKVRYWMTFNEPVGYCMEGYVRKKYPPFKNKDFRLCGKVVYHMLTAHIATYHSFKKQQPDAQIGFCKVFQPLHAYHKYNPIEQALCYYMNYLLHDSVLEFFKTGNFTWMNQTYKNKYAPHSLDWFGINYYTRSVIKLDVWNGKLGPAQAADAIMLGSGRELYPEGLRWAIQKATQAFPAMPLFITENGVNDPQDQWKDKFMRQHLQVVAQEIKKNPQIIGYFWWALTDTASWKHKLGESRMGLYHVDFDTLTITLKPGAKNFVAFIKNLQEQAVIA